MEDRFPKAERRPGRSPLSLMTTEAPENVQLPMQRLRTSAKQSMLNLKRSNALAA